MSPPAIPIDRLLVPAASAAAPPGFEPMQIAIRQGLPQPIDLGSAGSLLLVVATGHAVRWRDADPEAVVSSSAGQRAPGEGAPATPVLLVYRRSGAIRGIAPLVAGRRAALPSDAPIVEIVVLDWELRAGNLRGAADVGSFLRLAWRRLPRGAERFAPPALNPEVMRRG